MAEGYIHTKDPEAVKDAQIKWADWLEGDTINASSWIVPTGITKDSDSKTSSATVIWLSGGVDGTDYALVNRIYSVGGRTEEASLLIQVRTSLGFTIGGRQIVDDIRFDVDDEDADDYTYPLNRLNSLIQRAVEFYSLYRPRKVEGTLSVLADVSVYALPSDCVRLDECEYRTTAEVDDEVLNAQYPWMYEDWDWPSLTLIRNELIARYDELGQGVWEQINCPSYPGGGQYVILYPPPEQAETIDIRYTAAHSRSTADYKTVPSEDAEIIIDLVVGHILRREANKIQQGVVDYRAGQTRIRHDPQALRQAARERLQDARRRLQGAIIQRGRRGIP